jgi:hypothetical protein
MAENLIIVDGRFIDTSAVLESSQSAARMPASNLFKSQPTDRWRSINLTAYVEGKFDQSYGIDFVAPLFANVSSSATWRWRQASSQANLTASPSYDSGSVDFPLNKSLVNYDDWLRIHSFIDLNTHTPSVGSQGLQTTQYWRLDVSDGSNPDEYIDIGRLYAAARYQPSNNFDFGHSLPMFVEESRSIESEGGLEKSVIRPRRRQSRFVLKLTSEQEVFENMFEIGRMRGTSKDILVVPSPDSTWAHHYMIYGKMIESAQLVSVTHGIYEVSFTIREMV